MKPDVSVIIVSYNTADLLRKCLQSLAKQQGVAAEIFVVDNNSQDQSAQMVENEFPRVRLIANSENFGFGKANNIAANEAKGKYLYLLNPDTEIPEQDCLATIIRHMDNHPKVAMAGNKIYFPNLLPQESVEYRYPGQRYTKDELNSLPGNIAWLLGACLIIRRKVYEMVGGFDEIFFLYGEDLDLGLKVRKAGWELDFIEDAHIIHWEGQSERNSLPIDVWRKKFKAEILFYRKHYHRKTLHKIKKATLLQGYWRVLTLNLSLPFINRQAKPKALAKLKKYQLAIEVFKTL